MAQGIRFIKTFSFIFLGEKIKKIYKMKKFQIIQRTSDGITCYQKVKINGNTIWAFQLACPVKYTLENNVWLTSDNIYTLDGQIKDFKFSTFDIE